MSPSKDYFLNILDAIICITFVSVLTVRTKYSYVLFKAGRVLPASPFVKKKKKH